MPMLSQGVFSYKNPKSVAWIELKCLQTFRNSEITRNVLWKTAGEKKRIFPDLTLLGSLPRFLIKISFRSNSNNWELRLVSRYNH